jgi:hypothetical protein
MQKEKRPPPYKEPTEPTPERSDSYYHLMTLDLAKKVQSRYDANRLASGELDEKYVPKDEFEKAVLEEEPTLGTTAQREQIIAASVQATRDYREEEAHRLFKARFFYFCFFSNFLGMTLTLYSKSYTVLFERYDPNPTAFYCSLTLYLPTVLFVIYAYCPCKNERERRKRMDTARKIRTHYKYKAHSYYHGHEDSDEEEAESLAKEARKKGGKKTHSSFIKPDPAAGTSTGAGGGGGRTSVSQGGGTGMTPGRSSIKKTSVVLPVGAAPAAGAGTGTTSKKVSVKFK